MKHTPGTLVSVLVADPPWSFGDKLPGNGRGAEKHYKTLSVADVMRFPLPEQLGEDALLLLWRVASQPLEALKVVEAWGFTPKAEIVWVKGDPDDVDAPPRMGMGHYVRNEHEVAILGTRGRFKVDDRGVRSTFRAPRGAHSAKPDAFFALVERLAGPEREGQLCELFGRAPRPGWHVFGDEIPQGYAWTPRGTLVVPAVPPPAPTYDVPAGAAVGALVVNPGPDSKAMTADEIATAAGISTVLGGIVHPPSTVGSNPGAWSVARLLSEQRVALACFDDAPPTPLESPLPADEEYKYPRPPNEAAVLEHAATRAARGPLPDHVIGDLGEHPALVDKDRRERFLGRAVRERILGHADLADGPDAAWITLQYKAPPSWFAAGPDTGLLPGENLSALAGDLAAHGRTVNLRDLAAWSPTRRDVARAWLAGGADPDEAPEWLTEACAGAPGCPDGKHAFAPCGASRRCDRCSTWEPAGANPGAPFSEEIVPVGPEHAGTFAKGPEPARAAEAPPPAPPAPLPASPEAAAAPPAKRGRGRTKKANGQAPPTTNGTPAAKYEGLHWASAAARLAAWEASDAEDWDPVT